MRITYFVILLFLSHAGWSRIIYVNHTAEAANDSTSWSDAYTDLQDALANGLPHDEIWVAQGTYKPSPNSDRSKSFRLKSLLALYGGFQGTEGARDERVWQSFETILSGDLLGNDNGIL